MNSCSKAHEMCYCHSKVHKFCVNSGWKFGRSYVRHCKNHDSRKPNGLIYSPPSQPNSARYFFILDRSPIYVFVKEESFLEVIGPKKLVCIFHVFHGYCMIRPSNSPRRK